MMKNDNNNGDVVDQTGSNNRLSRWHHNSSRIIRVSRASGGKDRHSKVWTSKGARDRRVRLSVSTALQFYDLQDRLGYDQPSKAVEWLIKAAEDSISELPSLNNTNFPNDEDENRGENQLTGIGLVKPACSSNSNSDTSKNSSGLSLSRSELRDKARERARERTAKERETSFTDLLNSGSVNVNRNWMVNNPPPAPTTTSSLEYFTSGLILGSGQQQQTHYPVQSNFTNHHQEFSFVPDHQMIPQGGSNGGFNLDFNMSSSSGFNRGTLQSNSTSHHQSFLANLQRFPTSEGGSAQFLFGETHGNSNGNNINNNNNHQFQLYYENGNSDQKG